MRRRGESFRSFLSVFVFAIVLVVSGFIVTPLTEIMALEGGFYADYSDIQTLNESGRFGFFQADIAQNEQSVAGQTEQKNEVVFKLFGLIPVKRVQVQMSDENEFYVGGVPIGLNINTAGAIVVSGDGTLKEGDIILKINGVELGGIEDIEGALGVEQGFGNDAHTAENLGVVEVLSDENEVEVEFMRKGKILKTLVKTSESEDGKLRLGLWVKDDISGIGTLTYVGQDGSFGALGHAILENGSIVPISDGQVYDCNLIGIEKGEKNNPGQLRCVLMSNSQKGTIEDNSKFGIRGTLSDMSEFVDENLTAKLGGRLGVKMGKATIVSSISGIREEYEIEIIKTNYQKSADDKSMVFRVKDERLLELTGGIVQGMSGSPIMQDGKIIGAVTHVFVNDASKGYGVYVDWML